MKTLFEIKNRILIKIFPFVQMDEDCYDVTWFDCVEDGWKLTIFLPFCIRVWWKLFWHGGYSELKKYHITDIKEKWGHFDINSFIHIDCPDIHPLERKYEWLSYRHCIRCGRHTKYRTTGWIQYYCEDCARDIKSTNIVIRIPDDEMKKIYEK